MIPKLQIGSTVIVPRTGGGTSIGMITDFPCAELAVVEFPLGSTYRGKPSPLEDRKKTARKTVPINDLTCR